MNFDLFEILKYGAKLKKWPKMTINDLYVTYEVKVDL